MASKTKIPRKRFSGKKSECDDMLFGKSKLAHDPAEIEKVRQEVLIGKSKNPNVVVIPEKELERMKKEAVIVTLDEQLQQRKIIEEQKEKQQAMAVAKKKKMMEKEEEKRNQTELNELEKEGKEKKADLLNQAKEKLNEQLDEVKHMNQMVSYAKCVTVRDKQLDEMKIIGKGKIQEQKRLDLMMEVGRLNKIKEIEEKESKRKTLQKEGHLVIMDQMKERQLKRLKEKEVLAKEAGEMLRHTKELEIEEKQNTLNRKHHQKILLDGILDANGKAIEKKHIIHQREKDEDEKIMVYLMEKATKEQEIVEDAKRLKDEKEKEVARLRELQEKAADRQSEIDALRAKRAMESAERTAREKEIREATLRNKKNQELQEARRLQALEKESRMQDQAKQERDEFQRIVEAQKAHRDHEVKLDKDRIDMIKLHSIELRKQMATNEEQDKQKARDKYEEGKKIRDKLDNERRTLERIKQNKLGHLYQQAIPDKYTSELARKKIII